jgi:hypothetical protein
LIYPLKKLAKTNKKKEKLKQCDVCGQTRVKPEAPPLVAVVPSQPCEVWQADYIGYFPADAETGANCSLQIIDCFSKRLLAFPGVGYLFCFLCC